jgi:uncharacterized protein YndB with AHSA1/START domain
MTHEFEVRKEIALDATSEEVWEAIATGPGIDSWYMGRTELEPRVGGRGGLTLGGHTQESTVTAWEPGERLAYRTPENADGTFMAFEYLIEGRDGGGAVLRLVHSGFLGDDWETEYEALKTGWDMYLAKLAEYLTYFRGRVATPVFAARPQGPAPERLWAVLAGELGLTGEVREGDRASLTVEGLPPIDGVIDYAAPPHFLGIRTGDAMYRFIHSGADRGNVVVLGHHLFTDAVEQKEAESAWQAWLDGLSFA